MARSAGVMHARESTICADRATSQSACTVMERALGNDGRLCVERQDAMSLRKSRWI